MSSKSDLNKIATILSTRGHKQYGGENVTQLEHALQCAYLAEQADATPTAIAACLLHDFGHLVDDVIEDRHEYRALDFLRPLFGEAVTEPIRLHVEAKRYLCAVDPNYQTILSLASQHSLILQGGIFSLEVAQRFIQQPYALAAVELRRWDEQAKIPHLTTPDLAHFITIIRQEFRLCN